MRATVGPGTIIIRDKDKQAELEASGATASLDTLNRDPDKAYEITKDKHVEIDYYLSDTSVKQAYEAGKTVVEVVGSAIDRMISDGKLSPASANLKPYLNDPDVRAQLEQCRNHASADYNPLNWIVTSAYAGAMCSIQTAGGVIVLGPQDALLLTALQAEAAIGFGIAALIASPIVLLTTGPAGNQKDQTVTLANGAVVSVTGVGDELNRNVSITANGSTTTLIVADDGFGGLIISGGTINGLSMTYGELERAKRELGNAGYDVALSEGARGNGSSEGGASKGGSGAAAGAPDPDDDDRNHSTRNTPERAEDVRQIVKESTSSYGKSGNAFNVATETELRALYNEITASGRSIPSGSYDGVFKQLSDGTRIGLRNSSTTGGSTIDVFPKNGTPYKIHIQP